MRLWQATWDSPRSLLLIWGEQAQSYERSLETPAREIGAAALSRRTPPADLLCFFRQHPFACPPSLLARDLRDLEFEPQSSKVIELFLPTNGQGPLASPRLPSAVERDARAPLKLWQVPAVTLDALDALSFLTSLPESLPQGLRLDQSILFWREATKLLLELLTRGRLVPGLGRSGGRWRSQWHILPQSEEDRRRLTVLAEEMPPLCRALPKRGNPRSREPSAILESFLAVCGDALIRAFLSRHDLLQNVRLDKVPKRQQLYVEWLASLTRPDPSLYGPEYELIKFEQRLRTWAGGSLLPVQPHQIAVLFRLIEPTRSKEKGEEDKGEEQADRWLVEFALQSTDDRTQELSAAELWSGELGFLQQAEFTFEELEDRLLRDLGKALHVFPALRSALVETHPTHVILDTTGAYAFLKHSAPLLTQHGYQVELPSWWSEQETQLGLRLNVASSELPEGRTGFGFLAAQELLDFSWSISLGDQELDLDAFRALVERSVPLMRMNNQWIELQPKKLSSTLAFLERQKARDKMRFIDALRFGLGLEQEEDLLPVTGFQASGWIEQLLSTAPGAADGRRVPLLEAPEGFLGTLRGYQQEGLSWLAFLTKVGVGGCLADDMGLGKTIQLLALLLHEREIARTQEGAASAPAIGPTLLVVPMSILANWEYEAKRFAPALRTYVHHGPARLTGGEFTALAARTDLIITTYSLVHRDQALVAQVPWRRIALDEAQNIKNLDAKQTKAVRRLVRECLSRPDTNEVCHRLALTGTPLENHLEELWSIFDFLNPGFLGTIKEFRSRFVMPIERYRNKQSADVLSKLIQPFVLRRLKSDPKVIDDLPEKIEMQVLTGLTEEQASLYQSVVEHMLPQVGAAAGFHRKGLVLATITKLKQICNHPALFLKDRSSLEGRSGKLERLEEILEVILAEGDRALIFSQYAEMGHLLKPYLQERFGTEVLFLHGALSRSAREKVLERFRAKDGPSIFLLSLKAGGFGLNLTEANQVIHFDQWWNPAVEEQATDRAYRIGQVRSVQVRKFICQGTLEEKIHAMLQHKRDLAEQVVGSTKNMVTQLSVEELRQLLQLTLP